jgi:hypothetical protein
MPYSRKLYIYFFIWAVAGVIIAHRSLQDLSALFALASARFMPLQ